ncbi:MAG TPA: hypothetical protein VFF68_01595 [Anaerolineaceae bacterium]|nr:hypothetical protein [Anaerolineaceae bacterium]
MSKKQKRQVSAVAPVSEPVEPKRTRSSASDFNPDYSYVLKDLKRIGTLAGSFFVILVALSFFLR